MLATSAHAHGIAGNRLFPGTLLFDDPAVADELSGPILSNQTHPVFGASDVRDTSVEASFSRLLLPDLAIGVDSDWTRHEAHDDSTETAFQISAEAIVPLTRFGGSPGFRLGVLFFLDDLIPGLFGKPVFH